MKVTFKTHPNFKCTFDPSIKDINNVIYIHWGINTLKNQEKFTKLTSLEEEEKNKSFKIDPEKFDRIYYIRNGESENRKNFKSVIIARIDQGGSSSSPLYIYIKVYGIYNDKEYRDGVYFLSDNANLFMTICKRQIGEKYHKMILESLTQDYGENWRITKYEEYEKKIVDAEKQQEWEYDEDGCIIYQPIKWPDNEEDKDFVSFRELRERYIDELRILNRNNKWYIDEDGTRMKNTIIKCIDRYIDENELKIDKEPIMECIDKYLVHARLYNGR